MNYLKCGPPPSSRLFLFCFLIAGFGFSLFGQPYVDLLQARYMYALKNNNTPATPFTHFWIGSDLPIKLKPETFLLLSPFYEQWVLDSAETKEIYPVMQSLALPVGLIFPLKNTKWAVTFVPIVRTNGETLFAENTFQYGAVTFATWTRKPNQKFRFGVYTNAEFFGFFIIPLLGADWRIDDRNYLFGVLPGRLTYEHQWSNKFFWGATFRAPTSSYRLADGSFVRLDDNQLSVFIDYYISKHLCITLEPGVGVVRRIRTGIDTKNYLTKVKWGDSSFLKLSASYRIRFEVETLVD